MKKFLPTVLLLAFCFYSRAQWVTIPDANFAALLQANYPSCMNGNQLDTVCAAGIDSTHLNASGYSITDFTGVEYLDKLTYLDITFNAHSSINALPPNLQNFYCYWCDLNSLPPLPSTLTLLTCMNNNLTSLPVLPAMLYELDCSYNFLDSLPVLPPYLSWLLCNNNQLTVLPSLPNTLEHLYCSSNFLSSLPPLPLNTLIDLYCINNVLNSLPPLPTGLQVFKCANNNITCLPTLPFIYSPNAFEIDGNPFTCLPNYVPAMNNSLLAYPLCMGSDEVNNPQKCIGAGGISGHAYADANTNCAYDNADTRLFNIPFRVLNANDSVIAEYTAFSNGVYQFTQPAGTYTIQVDTTNLPFAIACAEPGIDSMVTLNGSNPAAFGVDFSFNCLPGFDLVAQSIEGRFRSATTRQVNIHAGNATGFYGANCISGISGTVTLGISGPVSYAGPAPGAVAPTVVNDSTLVWSIADFAAVDFFSYFNILMQTDTTAAVGAPLCLTLTVNPLSGDRVPENNILIQCFQVVNSCDPNEKKVSPAANIPVNQGSLTYTIYFQNTGNDTAYQIHVDDTLDTDLDASTFQLLAYSHQPIVQLKGKNIRFNFPNINLVDSHTNEPLSHGYVQYKIGLKENLAIGTAIKNTAFIYFDFNTAVVTNTTTNTIAVNTGLEELGIENAGFKMYPNPTSGSVNIVVDEELMGSALTVTDITGREMYGSVVSIQNSKFEIQNFSSGIYFVTIRKNGALLSRKLVVQR